MSAVDVKAVTTLRDSKIYALAARVPLLQHLIPVAGIQMNLELWLDENHLRALGDEDQRVFIAYTNKNRNTTLVSIKDSARLDNTFDIDNFLANYQIALAGDDGIDPTVDPVKAVELVIASAISYAACVVVGLEDQRAKSTSLCVLNSLMSILFNDPYDSIINLVEMKNEETGEFTTILNGVWRVKHRQ